MLPIIETLVVGALEVNCYIFGCPEHKKAIVIDPGDNPETIIKKLSDLNLVLSKIVNTHAHADHIGGNSKLRAPDIPLMIHEDDSTYLTSEENVDIAFYYGTSPSPKADHLLKDGDTVELCSHFSLDVIHTPGHSQGGICLKYNGFLFTGDTLFASSIGRSDLPGGSHETLINSIKTKLLILNDDTRIFPGHGSGSSISSEKKYNPFLR